MMGSGKRRANTTGSRSGLGALPGSDVIDCQIHATLGVIPVGSSSEDHGTIRVQGPRLVLVSEADQDLAILEDSPDTEALRACIGRGHRYRGILHPDRVSVDVDPAS